MPEDVALPEAVADATAKADFDGLDGIQNQEPEPPVEQPQLLDHLQRRARSNLLRAEVRGTLLSLVAGIQQSVPA